MDDHADWLIGALPKTMDASLGGRLTREFVAKYGANEELSRSLWCRFHSRGWCGPASDHYRSLRNQAHEWLAAEKNQTVIRWLEDYIDQLSAYIEEAERSLSDYADLYQQYSSLFLKRRGASGHDHPESVATTFSLSFEKLKTLWREGQSATS